MPRKTVPKQRGIFERPSGSGIWWISYCDAERQRHREKVGRRSDAIDLYKSRKADIRAGKKLPANLQRGAVSFKQLTDDILIYSANHHTDTRNLKSRVKKILPDFGGREAASIKAAEIDHWIAAHTKSAGTFNRYRALFSLIYREAVRNDKVPSNPARLVRQKNEGSGRIRYLLEEEEQALRKAIVMNFPEHLPELIIAIGTGMRKSEQYRLQWAQVNFGRGLIHLRKTKNFAARDIPMNSDVRAAFGTLKAGREKPNGAVFNIQNPKGWFESARTKAGVKDFRWHDCRHTFCSRLAMAGVPLKTIQILAGHKTIAMTARYAHLAPNTLRSAVEMITEAAQAARRSPEQSGTESGTASKMGSASRKNRISGMAANAR